MRLAGSLRRAALAVRPASPFVPIARSATVLTLLFIAACGGDSLTRPTTGTLVPTQPDLTLTGGVGTQIFPTVPLGESQTVGDARGLNASGQVTGGAFFPPSINQSGDADPYRWTSGGSAVRITGCCDSQAGNDINDAGAVVGITQANSVTLGSRGFVATGTSLTQLALLPGGDPELSSSAVAINNAGQIVGTSPAPGFTLHATLWSPSLVPQDLGTLGGSESRAIDINNSGQVIGWSQLAGNASSSFFLWSSGTGMQDLSAVNASITNVVEINDAGQITGTYIAPNGESHAFLFTPGSGLRDLGTLGGTSSAPTGLNSRGDVVGTSTVADGSAHAFLWTAAEGMEDITALSGVNNVRRLNDDLQTLAGVNPSAVGLSVQRGRPTLVQLQVTQSNAAPTALFSVACNGLTCVLDASGSLDDKPGLTYSWDLNKFPGNSATGAVVTVTYPHAGQRMPTLTVTDANGLSSSLTKTITITDYPIAAFTYTCTGLTCSFDSSGSNNNGNPLGTRNWYFGDGQSQYSSAAPSHTYAQPGTYAVTLEIMGNSTTPAATLTQQVTVSAPTQQNQPPVANFTYSCNGTVCTMDASSSTDDKGITSYAWNLGKAPGGTASGVSVTTDYWHNGPRTVTLTVTDAAGLSSSITKTVDVGTTPPPPVDAAPVARFTYSCSGTVCTLDASTSTDDVGITSYAWDLGKAPGGSATGVSVTTDYWHSSQRTVTLTVTDTKGQTNSVTKTVTVP